MARALIIGLVVVGVAFGVAVKADTPEEEFKQKERQRLKLIYLHVAEKVADEVPLERLREELNRLALVLRTQTDDQEAAHRVPEIEEVIIAEEEGVDLDEVTVRAVRRAMETVRVEQEQAAQVGRFQIVGLEGGGPTFLVIDTTTGEVWGGDGRPKLEPYRVMASVLEKQKQE